jgi:hypothetical protein
MELGPIPGIRGLTPASARSTEREDPALALARSERMGDDAYHPRGEEAERGLEEEDDESLEQDETDSAHPSGKPERNINLIA